MSEREYTIRGRTVRSIELDDVSLTRIVGEDTLLLYADEEVELTVDQAQRLAGALARMVAQIAIEKANSK